MKHDGSFRKAGVIGFPVAHSRSPMIHNHWLKLHGLAGSYEKIEVRPENLLTFFSSLAEQGLSGCNVTLPHKEGAFAFCKQRTPRAQALGAINTLWLENGILHGDNTDIEGFINNLDQGAPGWDGHHGQALVLGSGGAARPILYGLAERGITSIIITNRSQERAEALVAEFGPAVATFGCQLTVVPWNARGENLSAVDLVVNTTSLGMKGEPELDMPLEALPAHALVTDIVYVPLKTGLLLAAEKRGLKTVDGLGMLLHQAVTGFEHWFGLRPEVTEDLRALVEADIPRTA